MAQITLSEFADKMSEFLPIIMKEFAHRVSELYKGKITFPQFLLLDFLTKHGESKMTDMAGFMDVTTAAMTGIVDRLVKSGYAARMYDPDDRRIIKIRLTVKGAALVKKVNNQKRHMIIHIFGRISQKDREEYLRIVTKIRDILLRSGQADCPKNGIASPLRGSQ